MGTYCVTVQVVKEVTSEEKIEVYADDQDMAIDRVMEKAEARPEVKRVKFLDVEAVKTSASGTIP